MQLRIYQYIQFFADAVEPYFDVGLRHLRDPGAFAYGVLFVVEERDECPLFGLQLTDGTGQSDSGIAYDLSGRSVVGKLPKPSYPGNESGKVVVDVTVDASGRVTYASYRAQGSTTNSKRLVDAAVEAARKARFSSSESLMQTGTITYVFTLE